MSAMSSDTDELEIILAAKLSKKRRKEMIYYTVAGFILFSVILFLSLEEKRYQNKNMQIQTVFPNKNYHFSEVVMGFDNIKSQPRFLYSSYMNPVKTDTERKKVK